MAKVTIVLSDDGDKVDASLEFDPPVKDGVTDSAAQVMALDFIEFMATPEELREVKASA